jgi:ribonuclease D
MANRRRRSFEVALALALQVPEAEWPKLERKRGKRRTNEQLKRFDELKAVRDRIAADLQIDPAILASRGALEATSIDPASPALMRWQRELLGLEVPAPMA